MPFDSTTPAVRDYHTRGLLAAAAAAFSWGEYRRRWLAGESSRKMLVYSHPAVRVLWTVIKSGYFARPCSYFFSHGVRKK